MTRKNKYYENNAHFFMDISKLYNQSTIKYMYRVSMKWLKKKGNMMKKFKN